MKKTLILIMAFICSSAMSIEEPKPFLGKCLFEVLGKKLINKQCKITIESDGSFTIYEITRGESLGYFAMVQIDPDNKATASGYWNGARGSSHAHDELGLLMKNGACWSNEKSKICAWR